MHILITGSSGLIGSEAVLHYDSLGHTVVGIDNNMRERFFGKEGSTLWNLERLKGATYNTKFLNLDVSQFEAIHGVFEAFKFDLIIHCAAQPSHDKAAQMPKVDFEVNAVGTLNLLELCRIYSPEAVFCHMSTNKVYGDVPNELRLKELETRWDYADPNFDGIDETMRIDRCLHSLFGASKLAADVMAQEYGRYFGMAVGIFRGGCLTGPAHSGVELHGFLNYLVKAIMEDRVYTVFGYKGKQVRDQLHSTDVIGAFDAFRDDPRPGEVYNLGGGRKNSASVVECISALEGLTGKKLRTKYVEKNRRGDHICYISNLNKLKSHFPNWNVTVSLEKIFEGLLEGYEKETLN
jgi:CDP-paratose 2-epimerase